MLEDSKVCTKCKIEKLLKDFPGDDQKIDGKSSWCRKCNSRSNIIRNRKKYKAELAYRKKQIAYGVKYYHNRPDYKIKTVRSAAKHSLKRLYGLTLKDVGLMALAQNGRCKICGNMFKSSKDTHIDHEHITGKIRGLLCAGCNLGLGNFKEDRDLLKKAEVYLKFGGSL